MPLQPKASPSFSTALFRARPIHDLSALVEIRSRVETTSLVRPSPSTFSQQNRVDRLSNRPLEIWYLRECADCSCRPSALASGEILSIGTEQKSYFRSYRISVSASTVRHRLFVVIFD
ncbi:Hypothetical protein NTJ_04301 [Nesidiocoris tenuis]|uniref:Uncharacterized protein n=1 Tax=Nesidiocoris tenuis TaxID=355587 RepID=A0ABN7AHR7_9HEMI|nr:Hypothetical protein NTJ_04301 [Nesidiocoris tenuis]